MVVNIHFNNYRLKQTLTITFLKTGFKEYLWRKHIKVAGSYIKKQLQETINIFLSMVTLSILRQLVRSALSFMYGGSWPFGLALRALAVAVAVCCRVVWRRLGFAMLALELAIYFDFSFLVAMRTFEGTWAKGVAHGSHQGGQHLGPCRQRDPVTRIDPAGPGDVAPRTFQEGHLGTSRCRYPAPTNLQTMRIQPFMPIPRAVPLVGGL